MDINLKHSFYSSSFLDATSLFNEIQLLGLLEAILFVSFVVTNKIKNSRNAFFRTTHKVVINDKIRNYFKCFKPLTLSEVKKLFV